MATSFLSPRVRALANRNIKVGLLGSDATAARHAASARAHSILGDDGPCRPIAIEVSSAGKLASCVQSRAGVCALPACIETATKVMVRKPRAVSANTRIALYHTVAAARSTGRGRPGKSSLMMPPAPPTPLQGRVIGTLAHRSADHKHIEQLFRHDSRSTM